MGMRNLDISCKTGVFLIEIRRFENNKARYFKKIIRNKIRRKKYGDIIESVSVHDYETCSCGACSVDGGHYYLKRSAASWWVRCTEKRVDIVSYYGEFPCHRVVNHSGRLAPGWAEQGMLLRMEGVGMKDENHVDLKRFQWKV